MLCFLRLRQSHQCSFLQLQLVLQHLLLHDRPHCVHVVAGIIAMFWLLGRAKRGDFTPKYFGAVDYTALYWHLVDLIWIYLFPLLYLIS